jgi:hypothetical protein
MVESDCAHDAPGVWKWMLLNCYNLLYGLQMHYLVVSCFISGNLENNVIVLR